MPVIRFVFILLNILFPSFFPYSARTVGASDESTVIVSVFSHHYCDFYVFIAPHQTDVIPFPSRSSWSHGRRHSSSVGSTKTLTICGRVCLDPITSFHLVRPILDFPNFSPGGAPAWSSLSSYHPSILVFSSRSYGTLQTCSKQL